MESLTDNKNRFIKAFYLTLFVGLASPQLATSSEKICIDFLKTKRPYYEKLFSFMKKTQKINEEDSFNKLQHISSSSCALNSIQSHVKDLLSRHSGKIGILLPLSGPHRHTGLNFEAAIRTFYRKDPLRFKKTVVIADTKGLPRSFHQALAQMIFKEKVSLIIGGATSQEARLMQFWSHHLETTALLLHEKEAPSATRPYSFYVSPDQDQMSLTLTSYMRSQNYKRIAIFHPEKRQRRFVAQTKKHAKDRGIHVAYSYSYQDRNFKSLESSIIELFRLNDPERAEELAELIAAKKEAEAKDEEIENKKPEEDHDQTADIEDHEYEDAELAMIEQSEKPSEQVFLPPIVDVDAIILADHIKTLRHFVAILKYYNVPHIPLLGTQQWRTPEIFQPEESYLSGSVFVDYIGSYQDLPYRLKVSATDSEFFTSPGEAQILDLWLMARHSVDIADRILYILPDDRRDIKRLIEKIPARKHDPFFQSKKVFDPNHMSYWPTYLFTISGKSIYQLFSRPAESMRLIATPFHIQ